MTNIFRLLAHLKQFTYLCCFLTAFIIITSEAYAQSVTITEPASPRGNRNLGMHYNPTLGRTAFHKGQDYPVSTTISGRGTFECNPYKSDYGNSATIRHACGVEEFYAHLSKCSSSSVTTGSTGRSTGVHLHYEIRINNTPVNPASAFGKDLCNGDVRKQLLDEAKSRGGTGGSAADRQTSQAPAPPARPASEQTSFEYRPGSAPPGSGVNGTTPQGSDGYWVITTGDGRTWTEPFVEEGENETPPLPATTEQVTQTTETNNEVTGCATDTWTAMVNQSVMQVRREMMYNQRYVVKPDSIMAYACIETSLKNIGKEKKLNNFSGTKLWVNRQVDIIGKTVTVNKELGEDSLDGAINNAAISAAKTFINVSFMHDWLADSANGGSSGGGGGGDDHEGEGGSAQTEAPCTKMAEVWKIAKCMNFSDETPFKKFDQLIENNSDPRIYPKNMKCQNTGITQNMIDIAKGKDVKFDKVTSYLDMLKPDSGCYQQAFKTGVTVVIFEGSDRVAQKQSYPDGVCISPGCSYQRSGQCQ